MCGELETCSFALRLGLWMAIMLCKYGCTPVRSVVVPLALGLIGGVVVEEPTSICSGGVYGALEVGGLLASYSLRLRMDSRLCSGLCKNGCLL